MTPNPQLTPAAGTETRSAHTGTADSRSQVRRLAVLLVLLSGCFSKPLLELVRFALHSELFSHVLLIPFISAYLVWLRKDCLPAASRPQPWRAFIPFIAGILVLFGARFTSHLGLPIANPDYLTWTTLSFVLLFCAACFLSFGTRTLRALAFPLAFLVFFVPFPGFLTGWIETFLQHTSAVTAHAFFIASGMTFLRDGLFFQLPGMRLEVAPECSGIHSSLVLFITSLVAGQLFLLKLSNRALLAFAVIPLGIVRNAFRIWVIGELCVHISPTMIDSPIHRRGGPLFFAVSLVPLFLLLYYQRRSELRSKTSALPN